MRRIVLLGRLGEGQYQGQQKYEIPRDGEIHRLIGSVGCWCCDSWSCWICYVPYLSGLDHPVQSVSFLKRRILSMAEFL